MLKKVFFAIVFFLILISLWAVTAIPVFDGYADRYEITVKASSTAEFIKIGRNEFKLKSGIKSESFKIKAKEFDLRNFLSEYDAKTVLVEKTDSGVSYYAYSKQLKYNKTIKGERINIHINISDGEVTVGSPLIFGGF